MKNNIKELQLFTPEDKLLVAVSGGADSMVLCYVLLQLKYNIAIAHCNFQLRDEDSENDELFVKFFANEHKLKFYSKKIETKKHAAINKVSIQMAARQLRYAYFNELCLSHKFTRIVTAHHLNDSIETYFINTIRGSGIDGLQGIQASQHNIRRPLLPFTKKEILDYAKLNKIKFREDRSNTDEKYLRNNIRKNIIPKFKKLNPSFEQTILKQINLFGQYKKIVDLYTDKMALKVCESSEGLIKVNIPKLKKLESAELVLYTILNKYGFNSDVCIQIYNSLNGISGKAFKSISHSLVKDRDYLLIHSLKTKSEKPISIQTNFKLVCNPVSLRFTPVKSFEKSINNARIFIDADKLKFPLSLRHWQNGDKLKPLGLNGSKKISDIFVEKKLSQFDKELVYILENGNKEIIWAIGLKSDDRYKVTKTTKNILKIECKA